ncbi:uncharacterized protein LOC124630723 [Helicoverpa zea]|uniref:uncharacterized protein LOC124630723 n=1 Tax=Helicoverpa zea TaxID=7113 RepID=UPI001F5A5EF2|nr:uncharacterized protein LOC124630723 [Helicoverpa zea]
MQCFICVTYMIILCSANPTKTREIATTHEKRSLFRDVIESLRIHSQLPEDINQNDENNLSQNYVRYGYENEPSHLPSDAEYIPRRNDRIEMPSMKYRFPKSIDINSTDEMKSREEVVVYIDTNKYKHTTTKPKKDKRPRPPTVSYNKNKNQNKNKGEEDDVDLETDSDTDTESNPSDYIPWTNTMAGQSHIGHRDSQTVLKPTVIVNIRGTVSNKDSDIRIEGREEPANRTEPLQNIFNINQEIKIEKDGGKKKPSSTKQEISMVDSKKERSKIEEDMMMCETASWKPEENQEPRKFDSVLQILFSI